MKKLLFAMTFTLFTAPLFAQNNCLNMAKYYAIKAYHSEMGTVQGSDGISYMANLLEEVGSQLKFVVTIQDNNEDGESWIVDYLVTIDNSAQNCRKVSVCNEGSRE